MSLTRKAFKGSFVIIGGELLGQVCNLVRNAILARVLTKADFGVAALLAMTVSVFEIGGRLSIEYCLIQSKRGNEPRFMAVAHFFQATLGILSGVLILLAARPMAAFFDVRDATWALCGLAAIPLLRSFVHLDVYRMNRELRFGPSVLIDAIPQLAITLAVWPLTQVWHSYSVLIWLLIGRQFASTLASHFVAERPYRWAYDPATIREIMDFGWPMLVNGFLLFAIMQGDRFAVGVKYSVAELGVYAIASSITLLPAGTLFKISGSILLPLMSSAHGNASLFLRRFTTSAEIMALFSSLYGSLMVLAGGTLVVVVFGKNYFDAGALTAILGTGQALRLLRNLPTNGAMATGDTRNLMYSNLLRATGLALAFMVALDGASLAAIASCAIAGEAIALIGSLWRFSSVHHISIRTYLPAFSLALGFLGLCCTLHWLGLGSSSLWISLPATVVLLTGYLTLHLSIFKESRQLLFSKLVAALQSAKKLPA